MVCPCVSHFCTELQVVKNIVEDVEDCLQLEVFEAVSSMYVIHSDGQVRESDGFLMPLSSKQHWPLGTRWHGKRCYNACQATSMFVLGPTPINRQS